MPRDFIPITLDGEPSRLLKSAIESLRAAKRDIEKVRGWMLHHQDGSVYTDLETAFGLPAGKGDDVFVLVDGALQVLDGSVSGYAKELMDRVG